MAPVAVFCIKTMYQREGSVSMAAPRPWDLRGDTENSQSSLSKQRLSGGRRGGQTDMAQPGKVSNGINSLSVVKCQGQVSQAKSAQRIKGQPTYWKFAV